MTPISEIVSRLRGLHKSVKADALVTDRFLFSLFDKHVPLLLRRQDSQNKIMRIHHLFQSLDYLELVDVDKAEVPCKCFSTGCTFKRTKDKLPEILIGYWGPLIRSVTSLDFSEELELTYPTSFEKMTRQKNFRYNTTKYFWYHEGYLYFPNLEWDAVRVDALFKYDLRQVCEPNPCLSMQDKNLFIPEFLITEIEQLILTQDAAFRLNIPQDQAHDGKHVVSA